MSVGLGMVDDAKEGAEFLISASTVVNTPETVTKQLPSVMGLMHESLCPAFVAVVPGLTDDRHQMHIVCDGDEVIAGCC